MSVSGIKVVTVGKSFLLPYDVRHVDDSAQIMGTIAQFMPDVVVTSTFIPGVLSQTHFEIRKRWINVDPSASIEAICQAIENCYSFNLWTAHHYQKDNPLISVYTPAFNTGDYLAETYRSLKEQTYTNWEWVVIDDHSTDRTWERLEEMAKEDVRVRPFRTAKNIGKIGAVKDMATRMCDGEYLVELDHDDLLTDIALAEIKKAFEENKDAGMVYSNCSNFFENGTFHKFGDDFWKVRYHEEEYKGKKWTVCEQPDIYDRFGAHFTQSFAWFLTVGPNHVRAFRRKTLFDLGGYNAQLPVADDWDLYARMFLRSKCVLVKKHLYSYRFKDAWGNTTFKRNKAIQDHLALGRNNYAKEFAEVNARMIGAAPAAASAGSDKPCFVVASRTEDAATKIRGKLPDQDVFVKVGAKSIIEAYEEGRLFWKGRKRIVYVHDDVVFRDLPKFLLKVEKLGVGLHGPCGSQAPGALDKACWWDEKPLAGSYVQFFKDGPAPKEVVFQKAAAEVSWLDGFCLVAVEQNWSWKVSGDPVVWHGYDWLACKRTKLAGGKCFTIEQDQPLLGHEGYGRTEGLEEAMKVLRVLSKPDLEGHSDSSVAASKIPADVSQVGFVVLEAVTSELTVRCLESIRKWAPGAEVVLVANGCEPMPEAIKLSDKVVRLDVNLGFAAGCNRGAADVSRPVVCFMNNDAIFVDETPSKLVASINEKSSIVAPYSNRAKWPQGDIARENTPAVDQWPEMVVGLCMMLPADLYRNLGGFDSRMLTWEDDDFCVRARAWGVKPKVVGGTWVDHVRHATFTALKMDVQKVMVDNQAIFKKKNPVIRVIVIAKDEERSLPGFFAQFAMVTRDWCVLDTGSSDKTVEVARAMGARVETAAFKDFAASRNEALDRFAAGADWIIMFDPDERLDMHTVQHMKELLFRTDLDIFLAPLRAVYPNQTTRMFVPKPFLFRNKPDIRWIFKVHEKLVGSLKQGIVKNGMIDHIIQLHEDGRRQKVEGFYNSLMNAEPYFTKQDYKAKMRADWPILDYDRVDDPRIRKIFVGPLVSVVIPTFKRTELLGRALASVVAQDYVNVEAVVVGDRCPELDARRSDLEKDPRVRVFNLVKNYGAGGAVPRNHAIAAAAGQLIAYLDDDNVWKAEHLSSLFVTMQEKKASFAFSSMEADGVDLKFKEPKQGSLDTSCVLHKKSLVAKFGWWKNRVEAGYDHDWEFFSRWVKANEPWAATGKATLVYNVETCGQKDYLREKVKLVAKGR